MPKSKTVKKIQDSLAELPHDDLQAVARFVEFLRASATSKKKASQLSQSWAGALGEFKNKYSSLDLQKLGVSWRGD